MKQHTPLLVDEEWDGYVEGAGVVIIRVNHTISTWHLLPGSILSLPPVSFVTRARYMRGRVTQCSHALLLQTYMPRWMIR